MTRTHAKTRKLTRFTALAGDNTLLYPLTYYPKHPFNAFGGASTPHASALHRVMHGQEQTRQPRTTWEPPTIASSPLSPKTTQALLPPS
jgi:hypothetical protein